MPEPPELALVDDQRVFFISGVRAKAHHDTVQQIFP
jgi:hypothetical protein